MFAQRHVSLGLTKYTEGHLETDRTLRRRLFFFLIIEVLSIGPCSLLLGGEVDGLRWMSGNDRVPRVA